MQRHFLEQRAVAAQGSVGAGESASDTFHLGRAVREAAQLYETSAEAKGLQFFVEIAPEADTWFRYMDLTEAATFTLAMAEASLANPVIQRWETLMWTYQAPTPWTPDGEKWVEMKRIFDLSTQ
mgnify:CR=1 FL=1